MAETARRTGLTDALPMNALKDAGQRVLGLLVQSAAEAATARVNNLSDRLNSVAENPEQGLRTVLGRDEEQEEGNGESRPGALSRGFATLKEKIKNAFGGGGSGGQGKKLKVTVISEDQDIGLPLRTTYNMWTQFADFPSFMKKVESVEQESDEKTNWKAQVFWSHRTWEATIAEQVPDSHIVWRSKGPKGHVDGAVSFTELGPNLTRVMMVLEYHPQGLFERTGNLWRAQGRRSRLEFQHFRRHAMSHVLLHQEEVEGWRGEIRDSEVVKTHEEALEEEQRAQQPEPEEEAGAEETGEAAEEIGEAEEEPYDEDEAYEEEDEYYADEAEPSEVGDEKDLEDEYVDEEPDEDAEADTEVDEDSGDGQVEEAREPVSASRSRRGR